MTFADAIKAALYQLTKNPKVNPGEKVMAEDAKKAATFNEAMKQSAIGGGFVGGGIQPMGELNAAVDVVSGLKNTKLDTLMRAIDLLKSQAKRQLLPNENASYLKNIASPGLNAKLLKRAATETTGGIEQAINNLPNLLRR